MEDFDKVMAALAERGSPDGWLRQLGPAHLACFEPGGDTLIVAFERTDQLNRGPRKGDTLGQEVGARSGHAHLTLLSAGQTWFRDDAVHDFFDALVDSDFFDDFDRVLFIGSGSEGFAAATYSVTCPGALILLLAPHASQTPARAGWDQRFPEARRLDFTHRYGFAPDNAEAALRGVVLYDPASREDSMHAQLFHRGHTRPYRLRHVSSDIDLRLRELDLLHPLIETVLQDGMRPVDLFGVLRGRRAGINHALRVVARLDRGGSELRVAIACRAGLDIQDHPKLRARYDRALSALQREGRSLPARRAA